MRCDDFPIVGIDYFLTDCSIFSKFVNVVGEFQTNEISHKNIFVAIKLRGYDI